MTEKQYRKVPCCPNCWSTNYYKNKRAHEYRCLNCNVTFSQCDKKEMKVQPARPKFLKIKKAEVVACDLP